MKTWPRKSRFFLRLARACSRSCCSVCGAASMSAATMASPGLFLHLSQTDVVVRELIEMGQRDLTRDDRVVVGDVGGEIVDPVLELHIHPGLEFCDLEWSGRPVNADLLADLACPLDSEALASRHDLRLRPICPNAVSYTHLTLPTIYSV